MGVGVGIWKFDIDHGDWGPFDTFFSRLSGGVGLGTLLGWKGDAQMSSRW